MINERDISEKFSAIWKQNFPLMTPSFMRVFNDTQVEEINTIAVSNIENVRYDVVSEIAFNLSEESVLNNIQISEIIQDTCLFETLVSQTSSSIWYISKYGEDNLKLTPNEISMVDEISTNILEFIATVKGKSVSFNPKLKGCEFIPDLTADLSIDDTLYEIKTVNRNFRSSDLKQLFIYLALKQLSDDENWTYAGLYNPRKGTFCRFHIKTMISNLTGGKTPNEAFDNLMNGLVRDIEVDSVF